MLKKVAYKREPRLHVHNWIVAVSKLKVDGKKKFWFTKYLYAVNMKEAKAMALKQTKGTIIEMYSAKHNFVQAYEKI